MEFTILQDFEIIFSASTRTNPKIISKSSQHFQTGHQTPMENEWNNSVIVERLNEIILQWSKAKDIEKMDWSLKIAIGFPANPATYCETVGPAGGGLKLFARKSTPNILGTLDHLFGQRNVAVNIVVTRFGAKERTRKYPTIDWKADNIKLGIDPTSARWSFFHSPILLPEVMMTAWKNPKIDFAGTFTISLVLTGSAMCLLHSINLTQSTRFDPIKNVSDEETCTDTQIIVNTWPNQVTIKCHWVFLAAGSKVFQRMVTESKMKGSAEKKIEMEGISEKGVRAILAYLYYRGINEISESSELAVEVILAAEKYCIRNLKEDVGKVLMSKPSWWFGVDAAVVLFLFSKTLSLDSAVIFASSDQMSDSGVSGDAKRFWKSVLMKSLNVLKWYSKWSPQRLMESAKYQDIFRSNPQLGMTVDAVFLSLA